MTNVAVLTLLDAVRGHAADPDLLELLDPDVPDRSGTRLLTTDAYQLWLVSWPPGAATDWHDHGDAAGALTVLRGTLTEHTFDGGLRLVDVHPGDGRAFAPGWAHDLRNPGDEPALSLHAYAPRLHTTTRFGFRGDRLEALGVERAGEGW